MSQETPRWHLCDLVGTHTMQSITRRSWWPGAGRSASDDGPLAPLVEIEIDNCIRKFVCRSTTEESWLSAILTSLQRRDDAHVFEPPRVIEIRWHPICDDAIFAFEDKTGLVIFEVGTELNVDRDGELALGFVWECKLDGYMPKWLEPVDPDPPTEIKPKAKLSGDRLRKRTPTGRYVYRNT